jgi:hypothetical protein
MINLFEKAALVYFSDFFFYFLPWEMMKVIKLLW